MSGHSASMEKKRIAAMAAAIIIACLACSILTVAAYDRFFAQKVIAVDLAGYVAGEKERYVKGEISAGELLDNIDGALRRMEERSRKDVLVLDGAVSGDVKRLELGLEGPVRVKDRGNDRTE